MLIIYLFTIEITICIWESAGHFQAHPAVRDEVPNWGCHCWWFVCFAICLHWLALYELILLNSVSVLDLVWHFFDLCISLHHMSHAFQNNLLPASLLHLFDQGHLSQPAFRHRHPRPWHHPTAEGMIPICASFLNLQVFHGKITCKWSIFHCHF